jgi:hypothetical protein
MWLAPDRNEQVTETMPRYYFHVAYGDTAKIVNDGLELANKEDAWIEATTACGELILDLDGGLKPGDSWSMTVKDDSGAPVYELKFLTRSF